MDSRLATPAPCNKMDQEEALILCEAILAFVQHRLTITKDWYEIDSIIKFLLRIRKNEDDNAVLLQVALDKFTEFMTC